MSILQIVQRCTPPLPWELPSEVTISSTQAGKGGLWVDPVAFLQITGAWTLAEWALNTAQWLRPWALPPPKGRGRPRVYSDVSVFLADAAYFNYTFLGFVRDVLGASPVVDYNLRRKGKRFSATLFFLQQWKTAMGPRSNIERCFAFLKRYYGLANFQVKGLEAVTRYAFQVHIAMLMVALIATRCGRSELATSRAKVLAFVN